MRTWRRIGFGMVISAAGCAALLALPIVNARQRDAGSQSPTQGASDGRSATPLPDGRWLVLGGGLDAPSARAAILDPSTGIMTPLAGGLLQPRAEHTATVLPDGSVLVLGGRNGAAYVEVAELFDPSTALSTALSMIGPLSRGQHSATLLTDGRVVVAGGTNGGMQPLPVEIWDLPAHVATAFDGAGVDRLGHSATLMADGRVLLGAGRNRDGRAARAAVIVDPERMAVVPTTEVSPSGAPAVAASSPASGETGVPTSARVAIRFSAPLRIDTINAETIQLSGANGPVATRVIGAEGGRLVFVWPLDPLVEGASYVVSIDGATDASGDAVVAAPITFTTVEPPQWGDRSDAETWDPAATTAGGWRTNRSRSPWESLSPLAAPPGVTAVSGRVLTLDGRPLAGVALAMDGAHAESDRTGRFLLHPPFGSGRHVLDINGGTASRPGRTYGFFEYGVNVIAGQTTVLPFTIWMTKLDVAHQVRIPSPTSAEVVITTPSIPGLELHLPPGTTIRGEDGKPVKELTITPIPIDRPPFPLPSIEVPVYFTIQPGGGYVSTTGSARGAWLVYPNYRHAWPGKRIQFFHYDPPEKGWFVYGMGTVNADAEQVTPDARTRLYAFTGAMINSGQSPPPDAPPPDDCDGSCGGDPVSLATGLFVLNTTDLDVPDLFPLTLTRTYRSRDLDVRPFGVGTTHSFSMFIHSEFYYEQADLVLPDGAKVHYVRTSTGTGFTDAVFEHEERPNATPPTTATPTEFYKSVLLWNGTGWDLRLKNGVVYVFGETKPLQSIRDRLGHTIQFTWSQQGAGNLLKVASTNGRWIAFTYDASNRIAQALDNIGRTVAYAYDAGGNLATVTDPENHVTSYTYDSAHRMLTIKPPSLQGTSASLVINEFDTTAGSPTLGWVKKQTHADGGIYQFAYNVSNGMSTQTEMTDPGGFVRRVTFDANGYMVSETKALGLPEQQVTTFTRQSGSHFTTSTVDALNRHTVFTYDSLGNLLTTTRLAGTPDAATTTYTYEQSSYQIASVTNALNHTTVFQFDEQGNRSGVTDALGHTATVKYNGTGQITRVIDPLQHTTQIAYAGVDPVATTDPLGRVTRRFFDAGGRMLSQTDPSGQVTHFAYNRLNRLTSTTDPLGIVTTYAYDAAGRLATVVDGRNSTTTYGYDVFDRLSSRTDPLAKTETFAYDVNGNPTQRIDRNGQATTRTYDALNRLHQVSYADGSTVTYGYDGGNRLTTVTDSVSGTISRIFDDFDRVTSETTTQGSVSYTYDALDRRATMTVAGQPTVAYAYDDANRLLNVTTGSSVVTITYDDADRRSTLSLPNGVVIAYGYDSGNQLTSLSYTRGQTTLGTLTYGYDLSGRRIQLGGTWARTGLPQAVALATYDAANRLVQWGSTGLSYDSNGNLTSDGVTSYSWNARGQLAALSGASSASYQYDGARRRTTKTTDGQTTQFLYDGDGIVQHLTAGSPSANLLSGLEVDENWSRTEGANTRFVLSDALGSTIAESDQAGTVATEFSYEPFGATQSSGASTSGTLQYTGREREGGTSALYFNRARYYDDSHQRFLSEDPAEFAGGINLYAYAADDPINRSDPNGLDSDSQFCQRLREKMANVEERIGRRRGQLDENPQGLPESCPGDREKPSLSRNGHRRLINEDKALLAWLRVQYFMFCTDLPKPPPLPAPTPAQKTVIVGGGAALLIWILILSPIGI